MSRKVAIIPCGSEKLEGFHAAVDLYQGQFFKSCLKAALAFLAGEGGDLDDLFILSAKHGLVPARAILESYDCRWGDEGEASADLIRAQAVAHDLLDTDAYAFLPAEYYERLSVAVNPEYWFIADVFEAAPGIGYQRGANKNVRNAYGVV